MMLVRLRSISPREIPSWPARPVALRRSARDPVVARSSGRPADDGPLVGSARGRRARRRRPRPRRPRPARAALREVAVAASPQGRDARSIRGRRVRIRAAPCPDSDLGRKTTRGSLFPSAAKMYAVPYARRYGRQSAPSARAATVARARALQLSNADGRRRRAPRRAGAALVRAVGEARRAPRRRRGDARIQRFQRDWGVHDGQRPDLGQNVLVFTAEAARAVPGRPRLAWQGLRSHGGVRDEREGHKLGPLLCWLTLVVIREFPFYVGGEFSIFRRRDVLVQKPDQTS